jgi:hypothetical protein
MQLTLPYSANILRCISACLTLLPKEILSRPVVQCRCNRKAQRPCLHSHCFSQTDSGVLGDACWNLSESNYNRLHSVSFYRWWYSLNSQIAFTFWIALVYSTTTNIVYLALNIHNARKFYYCIPMVGVCDKGNETSISTIDEILDTRTAISYPVKTLRVTFHPFIRRGNGCQSRLTEHRVTFPSPSAPEHGLQLTTCVASDRWLCSIWKQDEFPDDHLLG